MEHSPTKEQLTEDLPVGGQAVLEGVMMRVPGKIVTAVRAPDQKIIVKEESHIALTQRHRWLNIPLLRGAVSFFEMMVIGLQALNFSADVAMQGEEENTAAQTEDDSWKNRLALAGTLAVSLGAGVGLFFFLPLFAAQLIDVRRDAMGFNLTAGLVRTLLFLAYLWGISHWRDIQRVFQYHGAEHKSIFTLEAGAQLTVEQARDFGRLHPRCGTSFLLIVVLLSIFVFSLADTGFVYVFGHPQNLLERFLTHLCFLPLISGISFELLKFSGKKRNHPLTRFLIAPGLWLQRITTREPDDDQIEVALVALRRALGEPAQTNFSLVTAGKTP
ncbi:MAG: DUF1385 domain-containing protein [Candidatus Latescibacteria bacterium]|nr:DUF1385 domain-containing protein [Candidatus Latescibacterota bacterium]